MNPRTAVALPAARERGVHEHLESAIVARMLGLGPGPSGIEATRRDPQTGTEDGNRIAGLLRRAPHSATSRRTVYGPSPMNLTEVGAQESMQHGPDIERRLIAPLGVPLRWEWRRRCRALGRQRSQRRSICVSHSAILS